MLSIDVVHGNPSMSLRTLDQWTNSAYQRELTNLRAATALRKERVGRTTLSRFGSERSSSTGLEDLAEFDVFGGVGIAGCADGNSSGDEGSVASVSSPAVTAHGRTPRKSQSVKRAQPSKTPTAKRAHSSLSDSTHSCHSDKTAFIACKRMRASLGYDDAVPIDRNALSSATTIGSQRRNHDPPRPEMGKFTTSVGHRRGAGGLYGGRRGRPPAVSYRSAIDA